MARLWLRLPDLPVMVTVAVPAAAEAVAANVRIALADVAPALNDPLTPVGRPMMLTVTVPAKPFCGVKVRVVVPVEPCATLSAVGDADNVNVGCGAMVSAIVVLLVRMPNAPPDVPVIVTVAVAAAVEAVAAKVSVLWPPMTALKVALTPKGSPEAASATGPLKPF